MFFPYRGVPLRNLRYISSPFTCPGCGNTVWLEFDAANFNLTAAICARCEWSMDDVRMRPIPAIPFTERSDALRRTIETTSATRHPKDYVTQLALAALEETPFPPKAYLN